jgi:hypothetical protein
MSKLRMKDILRVKCCVSADEGDNGDDGNDADDAELDSDYDGSGDDGRSRSRMPGDGNEGAHVRKEQQSEHQESGGPDPRECDDVLRQGRNSWEDGSKG